MFMIKNKRILKITLITLLICSSIGGVSAIASSKNHVQDKVDTLTEQFNSKRSKLEKNGTYNTNSKEAKNIKKLGIQIANLSEQTKTEADYRKELEEFIYGCKIGLEDTKREQEQHYDQATQDFIDKMEKKLADVEAEMKDNDKLSPNSSSVNRRISIASTSDRNTSDENTSKKLLEKLYDRSDVDNN